MKKACFVIWIIIMAVFMWCAILMSVSGYASDEFDGFAVDSNNLLYVGRVSGIDVFENGIMIKTIKPPPNKTYRFTIEDENIKLSNSQEVYLLDLDGNIISEAEDTYTHTYNELNKNKKEFIAKDGTKYNTHYKLGRLEILKNGEECVYTMPLSDYIVRILFTIASLNLVAIVTVALFKRFFSSKPLNVFDEEYFLNK